MDHEIFLKGMFGANQSDDSVSASVVCVTPEQARNLLALNYEHNRPVVKSHIAQFKRAHDANFFISGGAIRLAFNNGKYTLTDGQHRLESLVQSGRSATMVLVIADTEAAQDYARIDQIVRKRTITDSLDALEGAVYEDSSMMRRYYHASIRVIYSNFNQIAHLQKVLPIELLQTAKDYEPQMQFLSSFLLRRARGNTEGMGVYRAVVLAVALVTAKYANANIVREFWYQVQADDGLKANDPRKKLHNYLTGSGQGSAGAGRNDMLIATARCWNSFVSGETMELLRINGKVPSIALTPFPLKND